MLRLLGLVLSIGIADSLNPTTIAPALYLATAEHARVKVIEFTVGVFAVYLVGGLIIALGPGELILSLIPHPGRHLGYVLEVVAGVAMLAGGTFLWSYRGRLSERDAQPRFRTDGRSSALLGATITAVELPTAFPYFAAIAAIVAQGYGVVRIVLFVVLFNVCFVLPLVAIIATLTFAGPNAHRLLANARAWLERHWPVALAALAMLAGLFVTLLGFTGLAALHQGRLGAIARHLRHLLRLHP